MLKKVSEVSEVSGCRCRSRSKKAGAESGCVNAINDDVCVEIAEFLDLGATKGGKERILMTRISWNTRGGASRD